MASPSAAVKRMRSLSRREFLWLASVSAAGLATGCAANPVTGQSQLMLVSEDTEIDVDKKNSPHQFSSDYGVTQDQALNDYVNGIGKKLAGISHRPHMPYSFQVVNAVYVNAYAFPGGSIAATRGILLSLDSEAELAALLGHELGHVNARHTARQMSKGMLTQAVLSGISLYARVQAPGYDQVVSQVGMLGAGALLASYSRENEREADDLGMEYMVRVGYGSDGFVGLMDMLNTMSKHKSNAFELLFATHPMSEERYEMAVETANSLYRYAKENPLHKERYLDQTARLRAIKDAVEEMQKGDKSMGMQKYGEAEGHFKTALKQAPEDYTGLLLLAKCMLVQKRYDEALEYAEKAKQVYPGEAQARHLAGYAKVQKRRYNEAYEDFSAYERLLPGNPTIGFYKGYSLEGMGRIDAAADAYYRYLQAVKEGQRAQYAYSRLVQWGYVRR